MQTAPAPDGPAGRPRRRDGAAARGRVALNRHRQRELYGSPLGDRVRRLTATLGITQARLARTLGVSPAMLSQLASARRVKIGDPAVLARLLLLDQRCAAAPPRGRAAVEALLAEVAGPGCSGRRTTASRGRGAPVPAGPVPVGPGPAGTALRAVAPPARLAAAAAALAAGVPRAGRGAAAGRARPRDRRRTRAGERPAAGAASSLVA